jgi:hypothetical protein
MVNSALHLLISGLPLGYQPYTFLYPGYDNSSGYIALFRQALCRQGLFRQVKYSDFRQHVMYRTMAYVPIIKWCRRGRGVDGQVAWGCKVQEGGASPAKRNLMYNPRKFAVRRVGSRRACQYDRLGSFPTLSLRLI